MIRPNNTDQTISRFGSHTTLANNTSTIGKRRKRRGDRDAINVDAAETGYIEPKSSEIGSSPKNSKFSDLTSNKHEGGVDDMAAAATDQTTLDKFCKEILKFCKVRDEGPLSEFLGVVINRHEDGSIGLTQSTKCVKIAEAAGVKKEDVSKWVLPMKVSTGPLLVPTTPRDRMDQKEIDLVNSIDYRSVIRQALHSCMYTLVLTLAIVLVNSHVTAMMCVVCT